MTRGDLENAANVIRRGGVVAYPTESCYGLGCDPRQPAALQRLLQLKRRPWQMGLILIADRYERLLPFMAKLDAGTREKLAASWPGPLTWLVPAAARVSPRLRGQHRNIAVRVTAHAGAAALCRHVRGAIVSTSANRHGRPAAGDALAVRREFGDTVDYVLRGRLGKRTTPTPIRDVLSDQVIRP